MTKTLKTECKRAGRIMNDSWVCRFGCYHAVSDPRCECKCHWYLSNVIKERKFLN